jgi:hypothetical protein
MNAHNPRDMDRLTELLADEASAGIEPGDAPEFKALLDRNPRAERDELMRVAALTQVAFLHLDQRAKRRQAGERMPPGLKERLASQGEALAIRQRGPGLVRPVPAAGAQASPIRKTGDATARAVHASAAPAAATPPRPRPVGSGGMLAGLGWALAAALAVALVVVRTDGPATTLTPDAVAARSALVSEVPDIMTLPWAPPTAPGYEAVRGDVVWSPSRQQGYLRLANMPVNDPARTQYQLWIVDPDRDSKHPVDGGVFNVSASGEVIIPIQAKLPIRSPRAFAITVEQPGGVVVSAGPLLVVASI